MFDTFCDTLLAVGFGIASVCALCIGHLVAVWLIADGWRQNLVCAEAPQAADPC
jgi:hypothetical protein